MGALDSRGVRLGFAGLVLFTGLAADFWRNLFTWYGFGVILAFIVVFSIILVVHNRWRLAVGRLPYPLLVFLVLATVSIAWSFYPVSSVLGTIAQWVTTLTAIPVATLLTWPELVMVLGTVLRLILGGSFVFEFIVAAIIRHPILPVWVVPADPAHIPKPMYWSRALLFDGAKIQGILGNSALLAMVALLAVIVFAIQLASRSVRRLSGFFWLAVALFTLVIARAATIYLAFVVVVAVAIVVLIVRRARSPRARAAFFVTFGALAGLTVVAGVVFRTELFAILGKSSDLTGRVGIWNAVIHLAQEKPVIGWGWVSYWTPWVEPFKSLKVLNGVQVTHAHDAWLDVWLQLGIVGLVVFGAFVLSTVTRAWLVAVDSNLGTAQAAPSDAWISLLPLLVFSAQLIQSIAESRMLVEGGWILLVVWAVKTKAVFIPAAPSVRPALVSTGRPSA